MDYYGMRPSSGAASLEMPISAPFSGPVSSPGLLRPRTGALRLCSLSLRLISKSHKIAPIRTKLQ
jgi:hypothetical protein